MPTCPRERLDREQVRYLSREERRNYLTTVDKEGRLCWKRNGIRIDTSVKWKDSIHGIVPVEDNTPGYTPAAAEAAPSAGNSDSSSDDDSESDDADARNDRYVNKDIKVAQGPKKLLHVSPATIFNQLLRTSVKKNTWIFVSSGTTPVKNKRFEPPLTPIARSPTRASISTLGSSNREHSSIPPSSTAPESPQRG